MARGMQAMRADMRGEYAGLGLLVAWVYCSWFSPALFPSPGSATRNDISWLVSLAVCVAVIFGASKLLRCRSFSAVRGGYGLCAVLVGTGTLCLAGLLGGTSRGALLVGAIVTGLGSGMLYISWSEYMASLRSAEVRCAAALASVVALGSFLVAWALPMGVSVGFVAALPVLSVPFFRRGAALSAHRRSTLAAPTETEGDLAREKRHLVGRVFAVSVALSAITAFGWATAATFSDGQSLGVIFFGAVGGMILTLLVAMTAYLVRTSPNIARLYRLLIPLLVVALALLEVRPRPLSDEASALLIALGMGFDFFLLMYFGSLLAQRFSNGMRALCYCEAFTNLGLLLGNAVGGALVRASWATPAFLGNCYLVLMVVAVLVLGAMVEQQRTIDRLMPVEDRSAEAVVRMAERFGLTAREREILDFLARGRSVPFISDALFIQKSTVETHRKHIYAKLGVHTRQELLDLVDDYGNE